MDRNELIQGLRDLADFLEKNPGVHAPDTACVFDYFIDKREFLEAVDSLHRHGGFEQPAWSSKFAEAERRFGPVRLSYSIHRDRLLGAPVTPPDIDLRAMLDESGKDAEVAA